MSEEATKPEEDGRYYLINLHEAAAKMAHEVNRAYCQYLGDDSQLPWDEAPEWQRQSALMGVQTVAENPTITPAQQHSCWMAVKKSQGWVYGEEKDEEKKTHHCLVPYAELPSEQQFKDTLFGTTVRTMLGSAAAKVTATEPPETNND